MVKAAGSRQSAVGNVMSSQLSAGTVETLNGPISITLTPSPAINTNSMIVATDV
jgi:hypothetical protein